MASRPDRLSPLSLVSITGLCKPVCEQGCVNGTCVEPNACQCHFGYVGQNCSVECQCNKHSNCRGVGAQDQCLQCFNNTMVRRAKNHTGGAEGGSGCKAEGQPFGAGFLARQLCVLSAFLPSLRLQREAGSGWIARMGGGSIPEE